MAGVKMRSTRRLRSWIVEQVSSGKYPGLMWDDDSKTRFRIPWKHAGKQDFRKDEDAAIFKAWAEFKGKLTDGTQDNPANWKTRLRCALNKSPEFEEVTERAQLDISEPYKVYRLVPIGEQGLLPPEKKKREKVSRRSKRRRSSSSDSESEDVSPAQQIKTEEATPQPDCVQQSDSPVQTQQCVQNINVIRSDVAVLDLRIEENVPAPAAVQDSFDISVHYLGHEVLKCFIQGANVRITYLPSSVIPSTPAALSSRFPRIPLPEPPSSLPPGPELQALYTLLPFMERGVALTYEEKGVYGKRFCQGRVFWTGPHTTSPALLKMERNTEPVLLFSKEIFKQDLDAFRSNGGEPPKCTITLCFGEELKNQEDPSSKLIIVQINLPWAEKQVQKASSIRNSISLLHSLASQSPLGEITLNLVEVLPDAVVCDAV
ncbi:interferon regulatory factor 9 [Salarias fasciatus]|uniref:Interferon regulatory factor 9-like n=1 Tax=Salarias fasciatus TaxID=181472 RepID=A0A672GCG3_SALFA|nr:interferon regulatory factor 9-like [Salarias fasciatus]XP_029955453.1 interferon regulatory factor 9-like [Salarias fasciatus]